MGRKPIFLSMAVIDLKKAEKYQWLPAGMFPLLTHRIAAPRRPDDRHELPLVQGERDVSERRRLPVQSVISIMNILKFQYLLHRYLQYIGMQCIPGEYILVYSKLADKC